MHYFYILPFKDGRHIKCGISSEDINRIIKHNESFDVDIKKIAILNCNRKSLALKIEQWVLKSSKFPDSARKFKGIDGWTEIRLRSDMKKIKDSINRIKRDPYFTFAESKAIDYRFYSLNEWINKNTNNFNKSKIFEQVSKISNIQCNNNLKDVKPLNKDYFVITSENIEELINKYSLHLLNSGTKNPLEDLSFIIKNIELFKGQILSEEEMEIYEYIVSVYKDKPFIIKYKKDGQLYAIVCDVRIITLIIIKLNLLNSEEDYNKLCFKALVMYLQLGKKLRCSIHKIIESIEVV